MLELFRCAPISYQNMTDVDSKGWQSSCHLLEMSVWCCLEVVMAISGVSSPVIGGGDLCQIKLVPKMMVFCLEKGNIGTTTTTALRNL